MNKNKKTVLSIAILTATFASAKNFVIVVSDTDSVNYKHGPESVDVSETSWSDVGVPSCSFDKETSEYYYGQSFTQEESCNQNQEKTVTTTKTYSSGQVVVETEVKKQTIVEKSTLTVSGTHLESTCKGVQSFNASLISGVYTVNPSSNMSVYCDMTTSGGGWTLISKESGSGTNQALFTNYPINDGNPSTSVYRMSRSNMNSIQALTSEMRVDCRGSDHLETSSGHLFNGEGYVGADKCFNGSMITYTSASLKGNHVSNKSICTWYAATGSGAGQGCAGAFHIDEHAQEGYCGQPNYPWTGSPITKSSTDAMSIDAWTKDPTTDCHKSGAERFIMLR